MVTNRNLLEQLPTLAQDLGRNETLYSNKNFRIRLNDVIDQAGKRILVVTVCLEDRRENLAEFYELIYYGLQKQIINIHKLSAHLWQHEKIHLEDIWNNKLDMLITGNNLIHRTTN